MQVHQSNQKEKPSYINLKLSALYKHKGCKNSKNIAKWQIISIFYDLAKGGPFEQNSSARAGASLKLRALQGQGLSRG
jgi:hypothetical protein